MKPNYLFLAPGFEEIEAVTIVDILRRAQLNVTTVSLSGDLSVSGSHHIILEADTLYSDIEIKEAHLLILPGGMPGTNNLNAHEGLKKAIKEHAKAGKPLAAICAAPLILGQLGLLEGKKATCFPGFEQHLIGAILSDELVVMDGTILTGKGPGAAAPFAFKLVEWLSTPSQAEQLAKSMIF
jgi:4-methyl-5(b-hydroxyethyl)-thiazole monophosphate biosynthesis